MSWFYLLLAGLFEVVWAVGLKYSEGFTRLWPSVATLVAIIISLSLLGLSLKELPISTAYAIWSGIGAVGTVILGIFLFGEAVSALRLVCIALILTGIAGLKLT
ncbi:quaternary ammonium compound efflux SMR transporter SugE [uncultured Gilvimarinus sp.]|uniref:quaternary ammonium compound efflux SMR transporter SugE n=1 Tax=uncultured Gilvimarinus sp. TaxID=1689143 RepID=UPI0030EE9AEC|tara:strand:- start:2347 stop:2658 length:312 start_codon:yes stop_codon:yes gene_type:complete